MKPPFPLAVLFAAVLFAAAAAPESVAAQHLERSSTVAPTTGSASVQPRRISTARWISANDIQQVKARDAFEAVSRLRANWLRPRGVSSISLRGGTRVYLNGTRLGGIEELRQINADMIDSVQFLDGVEATLRFGTGNGDGAILVNTRP